MGKIILTTIGVMGDLPPFTALGRVLKARGHDVVVFTHSCHEAAVKKADLNFHPIDTPEEAAQFFQDDFLVNSPRQLPALFKKYFLPKVLGEYHKIVEECRGNKSVIIARATPRIAALMASETTGVPVVPLFTAPVTLAGMPILTELFSSVLAKDINSIRQQASLPPVEDWSRWWHSPRRSIGAWPGWFCSPEPSWPAGAEAVGFLLDDLGQAGVIPDDVEKVLSAGSPPVLITGGSYPALRAEFHAVCLEACQRVGRAAVLVTKHRDSIPLPLPPNVVWSEGLPFTSVMPRVGAIIHHGGIGTLGRAIAASVPQIILPFGADRPDNAERLSKQGIGEYFSRPNWKPELLAAALERALTSKEIKSRCQEFAQRSLPHDALSAACDLVETLLNESDRPVSPVRAATVATQPDREVQSKPDSRSGTRDFSRIIAGLSPEQRALLESKLGARKELKGLDTKTSSISLKADARSFPLLKFHHLGLAVRQPDEARIFLSMLGYQLGSPIFDPAQNVHLQLCTHASHPSVEIIWPGDTKGPIHKLIERQAAGIIYHICYETNDVASAIAQFREAKLSVTCISPPTPAPLFEGRRVSFYNVGGIGVIEILQVESPPTRT